MGHRDASQEAAAVAEEEDGYFLFHEKGLRGKTARARCSAWLAGRVQRLLALPGAPDEGEDRRTRAETANHNRGHTRDRCADVKRRGVRRFSFRFVGSSHRHTATRC